jgi:succinylglutamate desuccinylase
LSVHLLKKETQEYPEHVSQHIIGEIDGKNDGPRIIAIAGLHGNEPTGVQALEDLMNILKPYEDEVNGSLLALKGNTEALKVNKRYIDEDMNRLWRTSILDKIRRSDREDLVSVERRMIKDLLDIMDPLILNHDRPDKIILADLHTFSGQRGMFTITKRDEDHIKLLSQLRMPLIYGIENTLHGTTMDFADEWDHIGFAFESGSHGTQESRRNAVAGLMVLLVSSGYLNASTIPDYSRYYDFLMKQVAHLPKHVKFIYKHIIEDDDEFKMRPGFGNFDRVEVGDWLANDKYGKIKAQARGYLLMPLYQEQGNDGFFIVEDAD